MNVFLLYWLPLIISVACDIILSHFAGAKTIGELFSVMSILSFIPVMNILTSFCGILTLFGLAIKYIANIKYGKSC